MLRLKPHNLFFLLLLSLSLACVTSAPPSLTPYPTASTTDAVVQIATPTIMPSSQGWTMLMAGIEKRRYDVKKEDGLLIQETLHVWRIDPDLYAIDVAYSETLPRALEVWQQETDAEIVVNGGFFTAEFYTTGALIDNGQFFGQSYTDFGGMLGIKNGYPDIRDLVDTPYDATEPFNDMLQAFPVLVKNGRVNYWEQNDDAAQSARRTVVGVDDNGRFLIIIARQGGLTLAQLARSLTNSDLNLTTVLNLDGGTSTGILLREPDGKITGYPNFVPVPSVVTVKKR